MSHPPVPAQNGSTSGDSEYSSNGTGQYSSASSYGSTDAADLRQRWGASVQCRHLSSVAPSAPFLALRSFLMGSLVKQK